MELPLSTLLVRPREAFAAADGQLSLTQPTALVLIVSVMSISTIFPLYVELRKELPADVATLELAVGGTTTELPAAFALGILFGITLGFLFWVLTAVVLYGIGRVLGGDGSVRDTLVIVGWSHAPYLVVLPVILAIAFALAMTTPDASVRTVLHGSATITESETLVSFNGEGLMDAHSLFSYAQTFWAGYVWFGGVAIAHDLSKRRAAITAGIVVVLTMVLVQLP